MFKPAFFKSSQAAWTPLARGTKPDARLIPRARAWAGWSMVGFDMSTCTLPLGRDRNGNGGVTDERGEGGGMKRREEVEKMGRDEDKTKLM